MQFRLLGPVEIDDSGQLIRLSRRRERCLLAVLLLDPSRVVSIDRLAELLWDGEPPERARRIIHSHISRLRSALARESGVVIESVGNGYRIHVDAQAVDVHRFRDLNSQADAASDPAERADRLRAALDLWRGWPLEDAASDWLRDRLCTTLAEQRLTATENWLAVCIELGREREVLPELAQVAGAHPGRENLVELHVRALCQAGRKVEALEVYDRARRYLADELGLDPSPKLRELHQAVLRDQLTAAEPAAPEAAIPRQLPADITGFTGRGEQLEHLDALIDTDDANGGAVVISAIGGTAGVGKTALAVHWAHRAAGRFPDGQLYVNLRGYDPAQPMDPVDALARFLTALGVAGQDIPIDLDDRAARFRSELAGRRMLIVLDNAGSVDQVRPLLPGTRSCAVVVTSRDRLAGLVALHGGHRLDLDLLPPDDAIALLRRLIGPRVDAEPEVAVTLAEQCARLPLALRVAAELAASRPHAPLSELTGELDDKQRRLDVLDAGDDPHAAMRVVFSWSIKHLPSDAARMFRLLGLHPGPDFDSYAAAAIADSSLEYARQVLDQLTRAHLVHTTGPGRYGMHDLLRAYATDLAATEDAEEQRHAALDQLFNYYLSTAAAAMDSWYRAEVHRRPRIPSPATPIPSLADSDSARAWLDKERACLVVAATYAATHGWPSHAIQLSGTLFRYLEGNYRTDALTIHGHAYRAAEHAGDVAGQAQALGHLGVTYLQTDRYERATDYLQRALTLFRQAGDQTGEGLTLIRLAVAEGRLGRYVQASGYLQQALTPLRQVEDRDGEATALVNLGFVEQRLGRDGAAADYLRQALATFQQLGSQTGEATVLINLGEVEKHLGHYRQAAEHYRGALTLFRKLGHASGEADTLNGLGVVFIRLGQPEKATEHFEHGLILVREIGDQTSEAWSLNGLGEAAHARGHPVDSIKYHTDALVIATDIGIRDQQARAHSGIGVAYQCLGDLTRARTHYDEALALYTDLGMPEADDVRTKLVALSQPSSALDAFAASARPPQAAQR